MQFSRFLFFKESTESVHDRVTLDVAFVIYYRIYQFVHVCKIQEGNAIVNNK